MQEEQDIENQQQHNLEEFNNDGVLKHSEEELQRQQQQQQQHHLEEFNNDGVLKHSEEERQRQQQQQTANEEEMTHQIFIARERFLRLLLAAENSKCKLQMYENTTVNGLYLSSDVTFENVLVKDLQTPIAVYENACVRTSDVISLKLDVEL